MMTDHRFVEVKHPSSTQEADIWEPVVFRREEIEAETQRLANMTAPLDGRRESMFVHPRATEPGLSLAPGIAVKLAVLLPGERTRPIRHNSTNVGFCIQGGGRVVIDGRPVDFTQYDVWNLPSYRTYQYENPTDQIQVRLDYSNSPVLEKLFVHLVEEDPPAPETTRASESESGSAKASSEPVDDDLFGLVQLDNGASLMSYETLLRPPPVESRPLHWPWAEVKERLDRLDALGADYVGRRLYLMYNPATGRTNGTTQSFFATITNRPPGIVDRPHRHASAAVNYFFHGRGHSRVMGKRYEWEAGDLMLTAPGWAVHNHASYEDDRVYELTIQDQPYHLALESLMWQENMRHAPQLLGVDAGFSTNRQDIAPDGEAS